MTAGELLDMLSNIYFTTGISQLSWQHALMWAIGSLSFTLP